MATPKLTPPRHYLVRALIMQASRDCGAVDDEVSLLARYDNHLARALMVARQSVSQSCIVVAQNVIGQAPLSDVQHAHYLAALSEIETQTEQTLSISWLDFYWRIRRLLQRARQDAESRVDYVALFETARDHLLRDGHYMHRDDPVLLADAAGRALDRVPARFSASYMRQLRRLEEYSDTSNVMLGAPPPVRYTEDSSDNSASDVGDAYVVVPRARHIPDS